MCGVIGYVGKKSPCVDFIYSGLKKLEYRGYDSTGIVTVDDAGKLVFVKAEGKLDKLSPLLSRLPSTSSIGMGHTRWATHGAPSAENAHPHSHLGVSLIHNGILENYKELKARLIAEGVQFSSETDSEVFVHLLNKELMNVSSVKQAIINLIPKFTGAYALGIISEREPDTLYLVKQGSPLVVGLGEGENFFASDALALGERTNKFIFLEDGELVKMTRDRVSICQFNGEEISREPVRLDWSQAQAGKQGHRHFMLKEIYEQPAVVVNTVERLADGNAKYLSFSEGRKLDFNRINKIQITGCGTAFYAGMIGKYMLEPLLKVGVSIELASELRYSEPFIDEHTLMIAMTQSGETADTLACVKLAKKLGAQVLAICNVKFSSIARESDAVIYMEAGPEIGVASTKAFTAMVLNLYIFALDAASQMKKLGPELLERSIKNLRKLPTLVDQALGKEKQVTAIARKYFEVSNCLFVGRACNFPIALEGALKLKEISYIHAEGYAGGELKHGPIALIDHKMPVLTLVARDRHREKMLSNVEEIRARDGRILGIGAEDDEEFKSLCSDYLSCPQIEDEVLQTLISVIPLQLFAYNIAVLRGTDVDQPRNLAKSVTVE